MTSLALLSESLDVPTTLLASALCEHAVRDAPREAMSRKVLAVAWRHAGATIQETNNLEFKYRPPSDRSGQVVYILQAIHRGWNVFHSRFNLQGKKLRVVARLMQVAPMEPQRFLLRRLPHVALFAFPRSGVFGCI